MKRMHALITLLPVLLVGCSVASEPGPGAVLSMRYPIFSATSSQTMVRIDQDGRIEQAVRLPDGAGWKVFSSSVREDRVSSLMTATASVPPVQFREPESSPRYFSLTVETADGTIELVYNDSTLPCADDAVRRFQHVWTRLNDLLPQRLPESELPRCTTP